MYYFIVMCLTNHLTITKSQIKSVLKQVILIILLGCFYVARGQFEVNYFFKPFISQ